MDGGEPTPQKEEWEVRNEGKERNKVFEDIWQDWVGWGLRNGAGPVAQR